MKKPDKEVIITAIKSTAQCHYRIDQQMNALKAFFCCLKATRRLMNKDAADKGEKTLYGRP